MLNLFHRYYLEILLYLLLTCFSGWLGLFSISPYVPKSKIVIPLETNYPADHSTTINLWNGQIGYISKTENTVLVRETGSHGLDCQYYCPRAPNSEAQVILSFPVENSHSIDRALFSVRLHSFFEFDSEARVLLSVASNDYFGDEIVLAEFSSKTEESNISNAFDVTEYVKSGSNFRIILRGKCRRMLYHPTPNDPIGYAGAQLLRQRENEPWVAKLDIWYPK
jgi:hypothetical protein